MSWLFLSILTAISEASKDVFSKKGLRSTNVYIIALAYRLYAIPFLIPALLFFDFPKIQHEFWLALIFGGGLNVITTILYMKALNHSDLSVSVPMIAFTPLFLLITSPLIVGEFPSISGLIGVLLIVIGSYFLNLGEAKKGFFAPFKSLVQNKGSRYMLMVAFIWSITSNIDKIGVKASSPMFWAISVNAFIALAMIPVVYVKSKAFLNQLITNRRVLVPIGFFSAATLTFQMLAIDLALVAYVISVKRTSSVLVVLVGYWFFKEKGTAYRLIGASIMVAGVFFISML